MFTLSRMTWGEEVVGSVQASREISKRHAGSLVLRPFLFALFEFGKEALEERKQFTIGFDFLLVNPMADWIRLKHLVGFDELAYPFGGMAKDSCGDSGEDGSPRTLASVTRGRTKGTPKMSALS